MPQMNNIFEKIEKLHIALKGTLAVLAVFLLIYWISLFISLHSKPNDAYSFLTSESEKIMLQDTRVHSWSEVNARRD